MFSSTCGLDPTLFGGTWKRKKDDECVLLKSNKTISFSLHWSRSFLFLFSFRLFLDSFLSWITGTHNLKGSFPVYMLFRSWNTSVWQSSDNILGLYFVIPTFCFIYRTPLSIAFLSHFEHNSKDTLPPRTWRHTPPEEFDRFLLLGASSTPSSDRLFLLLVT